MKSEVTKAINLQIEKEREASVLYEALSIWCATMDYDGFARFFAHQADEEHGHAQKLIQHLVDRQETPVLGPIAAPKCAYASLAEVAETALTHEEANTKGVHDTFVIAQTALDFPSIGLLEWFAKEQVEEEAWANKMVKLTKRLTDPSAIYLLDHNIEKDLGE
jgi:ferritin